jgi:hypothetical protein
MALTMAYDTQEARAELLESIAEAADELGAALAALGAAYEQLDEASADRLEERLFRPVQVAYGRAQRTYGGFAERHGLATRAFAQQAAGLPSQGVRGFLDRALDAVAEADQLLVELQDSMRPVEIGDPELRAGLAEIRELVGDLSARGSDFLRTLGR